MAHFLMRITKLHFSTSIQPKQRHAQKTTQDATGRRLGDRFVQHFRDVTNKIRLF